MIYSVLGLAAHDFYSTETQLLSIGQANTTLKHSLSLVSCITTNHPGSSTLSTSSAHIRYTYLTAEPLNFNLTGTTIKPCATITLPAVGVWMVVRRGVFSTSVGSIVQYWNNHSFGISTLSTGFNANSPANIQLVYFASGGTGLGLTNTLTQGTTRIHTVTSTVSPNANLYLLALVNQITTGTPKIQQCITLIPELNEKNKSVVI